MILTVIILFIVFIVWAKNTHLDLITHGSGRVITDGQNKNVQVPDSATIIGFFVDEGDTVKKDQIIATISPTEAASVLQEVQTRLSNLTAQRIRINGELEGKDLEKVRASLRKLSTLSANAEISLMIARIGALSANLKSLRQEKVIGERDLSGMIAEITGREDTMKLLQKEISEVLPLIKIGAIGSSEKYRLERGITSLTTEINVLKEKKLRASATLELIDNKINTTKQEYRADLFQKRANVIEEVSELNARLPALEERLAQTEIRSPIDGIVNRVFFNTAGAVVNKGEVISELVPIGENLLIEAFIDPSDIATVEPGQTAKISLTAYDSTKYGYMSGTLIKVTADTIYREESRSSSYVVNLSIDELIYEDNGKPVTIVPGMIAQVDIIRGDRTVLEYFWQPVANIKDRAFRE